MDGVRNGLPLGAVTGARFERALHDAQADELLLGFRGLAQQTITVIEPAGADASEQELPPIVVDGLVLGTRWRALAAGGTDAELTALLHQVPARPASSASLASPPPRRRRSTGTLSI